MVVVTRLSGGLAVRQTSWDTGWGSWRLRWPQASDSGSFSISSVNTSRNMGLIV